MYRKILLAGTTAAVIVGAGGTALAVTGSDTTSGSASTSQHAKQTGKHKGKNKQGKGELRRLSHGEFVTKGKDGKFVTHDLIRGTVSSVSATSITVTAADKKSETFTVDKDTKVFQRTVVKKTAGQKKPTAAERKAHKPTKSSIAKVAQGDQVFVTGTGTSTLTAKRVLDLKS